MTSLKPNYINHVAICIDSSGSMSGLANDVVGVFDSVIKTLCSRSKEMDQETRVSVYLFDTVVRCLIFDKDVMRLPSLKGLYSTGGGTALLDGVNLSIDDLGKTAQMYGDHA